MQDQFIGKKIGNCEVIEKINEGGTAFIYRGRNDHFDLDRVIKVLKPSLTDEEDFYVRFKREAQLVARFDHPNIMRVFDTGEVDGYFYIEMEHMVGMTLREYMNANPRISERELLSIASQIVNALSYAHNAKIIGPKNEEIQGILHRDIKPENIMITHGKLVKLMDFGAAKPLNITSNTMQGMIVGTFHYMSPEQIAGETLDMRSDFFSLGIVLYELITGKKPFAADNLTVLIERIKSGKYERIRQIRPSISPLTEEMIDRLLARDRDHRPSSTDELKEALQHCIQSYESWGTSKKVRIPFSIRRHFGLIAVILSVVSLGLSLVAFGRTLFLEASPPQFNESASIPLLEKGRMLEWKQRWDEAINTYKMVPSLEKGGLANEYLEARIRMGAILLNHQSEYSKARKVFESLKKQYSDPAIDAYLGQCYFNLALYREAQERFESALKSTAGSVLPQSDDTKKEILYYSAYSIDKRNSGEERNEALKIEAIKAWDYYIEFAKCPKKGANPKCVFARKRRGLLESDTIDTK